MRRYFQCLQTHFAVPQIAADRTSFWLLSNRVRDFVSSPCAKFSSNLANDFIHFFKDIVGETRVSGSQRWQHPTLAKPDL